MKFKIHLVSIFTIIALLSSIQSQYIATSHKYDDVLMYRLEEIQTALGEPLLEALKAKTYEDITKDTITITGIKATSTDANVDDSYCDLRNQLYIISPEKLSILFTFNYKVGEAASKEGELELSVFDLVLNLKTKDEGAAPDSKATIRLKEKDFVVYADDQATLQKIFFELAAKSLTQRISESIAESLNKTILARLAKKKSFTLTLNPFFGDRQVTINFKDFMGFCEDSKGDYEAVVCFYSGNASDKIDRSLKGDIDPEFYTNTGLFKLFINFKIIPDIFKKVNEKGKITMELDKSSSIAKGLPYDFTVKSLRQIVSDSILQPFADTDAFTITTSIEDVSFLGGGINSKFRSGINIKDKKELIVIEIMATNRIGITIQHPKPKFNISFGQYFEAIEVKQITENAFKDFSKACEWVKDTLSKTNKIYLGKDMITLTDYFLKEIETMVIKEKGVELGGASLF